MSNHTEEVISIILSSKLRLVSRMYIQLGIIDHLLWNPHFCSQSISGCRHIPLWWKGVVLVFFFRMKIKSQSMYCFRSRQNSHWQTLSFWKRCSSLMSFSNLFNKNLSSSAFLFHVPLQLQQWGHIELGKAYIFMQRFSYCFLNTGFHHLTNVQLCPL